MAKTVEITDKETNLGTGEYLIDCIACKCSHSLATKAPNVDNAQWSFNGDLDSPTFHPSLVVKIRPADGSLKKCHSIIKNGKMEYLMDSTHDLSGHIVDLPEQ